MGARASPETPIAPGLGQPKEYKPAKCRRSTGAHSRARTPSSVDDLQRAPIGADHREVRALLEFLGVVQPDRPRREPVALPSWTRWVAPLILVLALAIASTLVFVAVEALF
jgi:hypothetical protein